MTAGQWVRARPIPVGPTWAEPVRGGLRSRAVHASGSVGTSKRVVCHNLPKGLLIYAFGAKLGGPSVPEDAQVLASQSGIPMSTLTLENHQSTYSHNDPAGAYPDNAFFDNLLPFLGKIGGSG